MAKKRVLIIYQESAHLVAAKDELYKVSSMHNVEIVAGGRIGLANVRNALRFSSKWDIVWFIVDSGWDKETNTGYMDLEGGANEDDIVSIVRSSGCDLAILNSCSSIAIGSAIAEQTKADVISTIVDVKDVLAVTFGVSMARLILDGKSYFDAFRLARPNGNKTYTYMSSLSGSQQSVPVSIVSTGREDLDSLARILEQIISLRSDIYNWRLGIENRLTRVEERVFPQTSKLTRHDLYNAVIVGLLGFSFAIAVVFLLKWYPQ